LGDITGNKPKILTRLFVPMLFLLRAHIFPFSPARSYFSLLIWGQPIKEGFSF
jgi:hypothetical protein